MYSRQATPPSAHNFYIPNSVESNNSSNGTYFSRNSSPESAAITPPRSPVRCQGPLLLPKVRPQDQVTEPTGGPVRHRRTTSSSSIGYASSSFNPYARPSPPLMRRGTSPPTHSALVSPISQPSPYEMSFHSALNSPISFTTSESRRPSLAHARSHSTSAVRSHSRSGSAGSIDESVIGRFGYPTYRQLPNYVTASSAPQPSSLNLVTAFPSQYHSQVQEVSQFTTTTSQDFQFSDFDPAPAVQYPLLPELQYDAFQESASTSSLLEYLTAPNPSPALVRRVTGVTRGIHLHYWWDIRNLRSWTDFNVSQIQSIPDLPKLLEFPISSTALPEPGRSNLQPENEAALHDLCANYYASKVNTALKIAQGAKHMTMRACRSPPGPRQQPEFISNYQDDGEKTIFGDGRGRIVGLVKAYDQWNTGMRGEAPPKQVLYLQGLAHLHRVMRENGTRYGFIMTEIELLCVRCGGPTSPDTTVVNAQNGTPLFGYLEVSAPIRLSTHGRHPETGNLQMTAGLALWYLHMLAKDNPFPGVGSWRMDVGGPAALTRQHCLEKDDWIPKPQQAERREAKRLRGWVLPEDQLSRRELGKGKRAKSRP